MDNDETAPGPSVSDADFAEVAWSQRRSFFHTVVILAPVTVLAIALTLLSASLLQRQERETLAASKAATDAERKVAGLSGDLERSRSDLSKSRTEISRKTADLAQTKTDLSDASRELSKARDDLSHATDELNRKNREIAALREKLLTMPVPPNPTPDPTPNPGVIPPQPDVPIPRDRRPTKSEPRPAPAPVGSGLACTPNFRIDEQKGRSIDDFFAMYIDNIDELKFAELVRSLFSSESQPGFLALAVSGRVCERVFAVSKDRATSIRRILSLRDMIFRASGRLAAPAGNGPHTLQVLLVEDTFPWIKVFARSAPTQFSIASAVRDRDGQMISVRCQACPASILSELQSVDVFLPSENWGQQITLTFTIGGAIAPQSYTLGRVR